MKSIACTVTGDPTHAKGALVSVLHDQGFVVTWTDEWTGFAERGSKTKNLLLGAFAQYMRFDLNVRSGPAGQAVVSCFQTSTGAMGGVWGVAKTRKAFDAAAEAIAAGLQEMGMLVSTDRQ